MKHIELAIIGAGPAGLSAAIYAARGGVETFIFERALIGGQIILTAEIENYPGFGEVQSGFELIEKMRLQAVRFGANFIEENINEIEVTADANLLKTEEETYHAKAIICTTGASPRLLNVPGEVKFTGRGVSYCATCDGALYRNKTVAVVGGGDSAVEEALFLTKFASKVYLIHRRDQLRAVYAIQQKAKANEKMEFILDTIVEQINGDTQVRSLSLLNKKTEQKSDLPIDGVFIYVGIIPNNDLLKDIVALEKDGFIITDDLMQTNVPGIYAAGDIRKKTLRQVVTACADGAIAAFEAEKYLNE